MLRKEEALELLKFADYVTPEPHLECQTTASFVSHVRSFRQVTRNMRIS